MTPGLRRLASDDIDSVVAFSLRAWAPVFDSFLTILGARVFHAVYPDNWSKIQAKAVASLCRDDAADVFVAVVDEKVVGFRP